MNKESLPFKCAEERRSVVPSRKKTNTFYFVHMRAYEHHFHVNNALHDDLAHILQQYVFPGSRATVR